MFDLSAFINILSRKCIPPPLHSQIISLLCRGNSDMKCRGWVGVCSGLAVTLAHASVVVQRERGVGRPGLERLLDHVLPLVVWDVLCPGWDAQHGQVHRRHGPLHQLHVVWGGGGARCMLQFSDDNLCWIRGHLTSNLVPDTNRTHTYPYLQVWLCPQHQTESCSYTLGGVLAVLLRQTDCLGIAVPFTPHAQCKTVWISIKKLGDSLSSIGMEARLLQAAASSGSSSSSLSTGGGWGKNRPIAYKKRSVQHRCFQLTLQIG